jgi:mono/diheme cytochrome c family protein
VISTDGPTIFRERGCSHCHEIEGVGGAKGPDLSGVGRRLKKAEIERQIVAGGDAMPAFGQVLPSEEIAALVGYLHKCKDKRMPLKPVVVAPVPQAGDGGF